MYPVFDCTMLIAVLTQPSGVWYAADALQRFPSSPLAPIQSRQSRPFAMSS